MSNSLVSIVGPTAIGKTALAIKLAQHFNTDIISADSRQFYKEMQIGTAVPLQSELAIVKHHFIHHKSVHDYYNVGAFEKDALERLDTLFKTNKVVVMVGGSGLYVDAVTKGLDNFPEVDPAIREKLNAILKKDGIAPLQKQLNQLDVATYKTTELDNPHRVIRALEICISTGQPYSSFLNKDKVKRNFKTITIGLTADRDIIYQRINDRVDNMMEKGLMEEVRTLFPKQHLNALNTVGYKELFSYLEGDCTLQFAVSEIKKNSRRFAKRQLTWFKKDQSILWFDYTAPPEEIIERIESAL